MTAISYAGAGNRHPKGTSACVLLSSVFGPYAQDDEFGSRIINPMELLHNQATREQGEFSPRRFHGSWGILMIQENISAPCTVLDFPTRESFIHELKASRYDIIGISGIIINLGKVREMCRLARQVSPHSVVIVGGHVAAYPDIENRVDADFVVKGEGIAWMRAYLGEDPAAPVRHPLLISGFGLRVMGLSLPAADRTTAAIIPSVGCPVGCNFCTTSAFFGGKGRMINFFPTGESLFRVMEEASVKLKSNSFSIMDENFLLNRKRAMELLELMKRKQKSWSIHTFSSANAIRQYSIDELLELGIATLWIGLESPKASYAKLRGIDLRQMTGELMDNGIVLMGSTIIGLEHHTPENIHQEIEAAAAYDTDFHQFMLYSPGPGTELFRKLEDEGRISIDEIDPADGHGQYKFVFEHEAISRDDSKVFLDLAFRRDFERNGPSLFRMIRTQFRGWKRHRCHPDPRIRARFRNQSASLRYAYPPLLWAMEQRLKDLNKPGSLKIRELREEMEREFGPTSAAAALILGPLLRLSGSREAKRMARGWTYEPRPAVYRRNLNGV
jgi:radical SAM superfamily enzyme YgiQ (UPF0313 family)